MPKVTGGVYGVAWVVIKGEKDPDHPMRVRDDGGLVTRFLQWSHTQKIYSLFTMSAGGGGLSALYQLEDAERIQAWLKENGVKPEEEGE